MPGFRYSIAELLDCLFEIARLTARYRFNSSTVVLYI